MGLRSVELERLRRLYFSAHEFGHRTDPGSLPLWTSELVADTAAVTHVFDLLEKSYSTRAALAVVCAGALENYFFVDRRTPSSEPYSRTSDITLSRLIQSGALELREAPTPRLRLRPEHAQTFVAMMRADWQSFARGQVPPSLRAEAVAPQVARLRELAWSCQPRLDAAA